MRTKRSHLSDGEILLFLDRELPSRRHVLARSHLADCHACSTRKAELEGASTIFSRIHDETVSAGDSNRLQSMLKARIAESVSRGQRRWPSRLLPMGSPSWQLACAGLALVIVGGGSWFLREYRLRHAGAQTIEYQLALPRRKLTPGAVLPVPVGELCATHTVENDPPVNPALQQAVFREYGLANSSRIASYALDYLITPALGGSSDIANLWPQPDSSTWNARVKDQLEDHLHELVCQGKIPLATAQNEIATDWISAYKRYFHTENPPIASYSQPSSNRLFTQL